MFLNAGVLSVHTADDCLPGNLLYRGLGESRTGSRRSLPCSRQERSRKLFNFSISDYELESSGLGMGRENSLFIVPFCYDSNWCRCI